MFLTRDSTMMTRLLKSTQPSVFSSNFTWLRTQGNMLSSTRNQAIQATMTHRALELLALPDDKPSFILDIGCGSGLSGEILEEEGHVWAGVDISPSMLGGYVH